LSRRLFLGYALTVGIVVVVLAATPVEIKPSPSAAEFAGIFGGALLMLIVHRILLRRVLHPLEELTKTISKIEPLDGGRRIHIASADAEVLALADAFNAMLDRLEDERRESGRRALAAQEAERSRIARELHDEIGQTLTGILLRGETLARSVRPELRPAAEDLRDAARQGAEDVRLIARRLRPEALDELGLRSALLALAARVQQTSGLVVDAAVEQGDLPLTAEQELVVYRVAQESLTNVVRHARATHAELSLTCSDDDGVVLEVRDDGVGLAKNGQEPSTGVTGMRERAFLVGARFSIAPVPPHGTAVRLALPFRSAA
jgi:two-component system sensor histidine kinase UhpB